MDAVQNTTEAPQGFASVDLSKAAAQGYQAGYRDGYDAALRAVLAHAPTHKAPDIRRPVEQRPQAKACYAALLDMATQGEPVTRSEWHAECARRGMVAHPHSGASGLDRSKAAAVFRARMSELREAGWIDVNGESIAPRHFD